MKCVSHRFGYPFTYSTPAVKLDTSIVTYGLFYREITSPSCGYTLHMLHCVVTVLFRWNVKCFSLKDELLVTACNNFNMFLESKVTIVCLCFRDACLFSRTSSKILMRFFFQRNPHIFEFYAWFVSQIVNFRNSDSILF